MDAELETACEEDEEYVDEITFIKQK